MTRIERLRSLKREHTAERTNILNTVTREERRDLTLDETRRFKEAVAAIKDINEQLEDLEAIEERSGRHNPETLASIKSTTRDGGGWAARAAKALSDMSGSQRAISSGSVDVPSLISPAVTARTRPARLIDLIVTRENLHGNAFEYFTHGTRANNAAAVPDLDDKPTSIFTVTPVTDRARVIAHLSEQIPIRLWQDAPEVVAFLESEMREGVLDKVEQQLITGAGTGEQLTGVLTATGTTTVAYNTSVPVTLRKARTALENIGVVPNAWVLNPADCEAIDLLRYSIAFDPEEATDSPQKYLLDGFTNGVANSANIFGDASIARVVSTSVPAGTAILGDWSQLKLFVRESMRLDVDAGGDNFKANAAVLRAEIRVGAGHLRPSSFAKIDLTP